MAPRIADKLRIAHRANRLSEDKDRLFAGSRNARAEAVVLIGDGVDDGQALAQGNVGMAGWPGPTWRSKRRTYPWCGTSGGWCQRRSAIAYNLLGLALAATGDPAPVCVSLRGGGARGIVLAEKLEGLPPLAGNMPEALFERGDFADPGLLPCFVEAGSGIALDVVETSSALPRPPERMTRPPAPEQAPALAVPAQHGFRPNEDEMASPVPVEAADEEPEELVSAVEARPALAMESDLKLLA